MIREDVTLEVDGDQYPGQVTGPEEPADSGVLVVPGATHGPFGDVFDRFVEAAAEEGHVVARFELWSQREDMDEKVAGAFAADLAAGVAFLRSRGCSTVAVVAKSFGGRLTLEFGPGGADRAVLWAPAALLGSYDEKPSLTAEQVAAFDVPVRLLQGDADEGLSVENAAALVEHLPDGELVELPGEDHSFQHDQERVVAETLEFLRA